MLPWVSGLVLIAGVVAFLVVKLGGGDSSANKAASSPPAAQSTAPPPSHAKTKAGGKTASNTGAGNGRQPVAARFDASARRVAGTFILTAVQRKHLARAWPLAGPAVRAGTTYKEWLTGNITVVPYLDPIAGAKFDIQSLGVNRASIGVALIPKRAKLRPQYFDMRLIKIGSGKSRHWVVNWWVPRVAIAVPAELSTP